MNNQQYFISSGPDNKMYTLRARWNETCFHSGAMLEREAYIRNLSTDKNKAVQKAKELGYHVEEANFTLEEIRRRNAEEIEAQNRAEREYQESLKTARESQYMEMVKNGMMPWGKNYGVKFEDLSDSTLLYWAKYGMEEKDSPTSDNSSVIISISNVILALFPNLIKEDQIKNGNGLYFGEVKTRYKNVQLKCVNITGYYGHYGAVNIYNFLSTNGELLTYKGSLDLDVDEGETIECDFSVKSHELYYDKHTTYILRIKNLNEVNK